MTPSSLDRRGFLQIGGGASAASLLGLGRAEAAEAKAREIAGSRYGLGPSDPARIDLVRKGLAEDALV